MSSNLLFLIIYTLLAIATAGGMLFASYLLGPRRNRELKDTPYECGMPILGTARERFSVKFYLTALAFLLFDIETVFLIPWAVVYKSLGVTGLVEAVIFILILAFGLYYIWERGALEWD
ncbi:MAG: NADH-quinone oxidoreductase subunit A [Planctomycetes bacterium]|nr:NADH-quinone oxidoreductase subunit A [Planctomycetota bacterium]